MVGHFEALQGFRWQVPVDSDELSTGAPTMFLFSEIIKRALARAKLARDALNRDRGRES